MKVSQLALLLDSLVQGLDGVVSATVSKDLKSFREAMRLFADNSVADFVGFIGKCEEYKRTGVVSGKKARASAKAADPAAVANAVSTTRTMLDDINRGLMTNQRIEEALAGFKKLTRPQIDQLLLDLKIGGRAKSKDDAIGKIRQMLKSQTEMYVKSHSG
jgi:hypothetical protein